VIKSISHRAATSVTKLSLFSLGSIGEVNLANKVLHENNIQQTRNKHIRIQCLLLLIYFFIYLQTHTHILKVITLKLDIIQIFTTFKTILPMNYTEILKYFLFHISLFLPNLHPNLISIPFETGWELNNNYKVIFKFISLTMTTPR
jgi:hypothetical protein